jgi:uncharacterized protein YbaP (TraB family)
MQIAMKHAGRGLVPLRAPILALLLALPAAGSAAPAADSALFWALSRDGRPAGYLLGTIHSEDARVLDFSEPFIERLGANAVFAMELVPDLPTLTRLSDYMHYQDGSTLESRIGAERLARLRTALAGYSVPADWINRMKVWAAVMTLSVPPPQTGFFMDFSLSLRAAGAGLKVVGLETLEEQLAFLENMPMEQQLALLDQALDEYQRVDEVHRQMVDSYLDGDLDALVDQTEEQLQAIDPAARDYFIAQGIDARNRRMLDSLLPHFDSGAVFVAVGALHLPGASGLIAGLRGAGFELTPLPLPFSAAQNGREPEQDRQQKAGDTPGGLDPDGRDAEHDEHQRRADAVTDAFADAAVAAGQLEQQVVEAQLATPVEDERQQGNDEQQGQLVVAGALGGDDIAFP